MTIDTSRCRRHLMTGFLLLSTAFACLTTRPVQAERWRSWQTQDEARDDSRHQERQSKEPRMRERGRDDRRNRYDDWPQMSHERNGRVLFNEPRPERKRRIRVLSPDGHVRDIIVDDRDD